MQQGSNESGNVRIFDSNFLVVRIFMVYKKSREISGNICHSHDKHEQKFFLLGLSHNVLDIPQNISIS